MNNYRITGESRQVGAIGVCEPFTENVVADTAKEAYSNVRACKYANNREHVSIKVVEVYDGNGYRTLVEPRAYLDY